MNKFRLNISCFFIILGCIVTFLLRHALVYKEPFLNCLYRFSRLFFSGNHNIFTLGKIGGKAVYVYPYCFLFIMIFVAYLLFRKRRGRPGTGEIAGALILNAFTAFSVITVFQTVAQVDYLKSCSKIIGKGTTAEKDREIFGTPYRYAVLCRDLLPGEHTGRLVTDMDTGRDPGMFDSRILAYFLYPIDIRKIRGDKPADVLLIYEKKDADKYVPDDYRIIESFDPGYLLAVKKSK